MKSFIATLGLAAMTNAFSFPQHVHYHRSNGTYNAGSTTLTVFTTKIHTITSCAPTITNCPADQTGIDQLPESAKTTAVVTDTIVLTETICPVTAASSIHSSILQQASTGSVPPQYTIGTAASTGSGPATTGKPAVTDSDNSGVSQSLTTVVHTHVTGQTLTLTYGGKPTTTVVYSTIEETVTVPCSEGNQVKTNELTTTTTGTKTETITLTISEARVTETKTAGNGSGNGNGKPAPPGGNAPVSTGANSPVTTGGANSGLGANGSCECNGATATVTVTAPASTVTAPASTVYVTVGQEKHTKPAGYGQGIVTDKAVTTMTTTKTTTHASAETGSNDDNDDESCEETTTTLEATVTVVPYPVNSTFPTSGYAKPSGFARLVR